MTEPTPRELAIAAAEERLAVIRARQTGNAPCACGHPKGRHVKLQGVYRECRWYYGRGNGRCHCGGYRPIAYGVEEPEAYEGILYWVGTDGVAFHRFTDRYRRAKAQPYVDAFNTGATQRAAADTNGD